MLKPMLFKNPIDLVGRSVQIYLKERANDKAAFYFYVEGAGVDYIAGFDSERLNLKIYMEDIDYVIGEEI